MKKKLWNRDFILLLQANAVSTLGDLMYSVAIGYWVYEQTGSSGLMGIMSSISMFVTMFFSPFCGSIVDKLSRKWVIVGIDVIQGLLMLTVGVLAYANALNVPIVLLAALLASFGSVFYSPAVNTLMLDIIPRDDMVRGQSIFSSVSSLINLVGTAFSGVMVAFLGVPLIVVINGLSNLYSAFSELFVHMPRTLQQGEPVTVKSVLQDSKNAISTIFSDRFMRLFIPCVLILNLLGTGPIALALPFCMEKGFSVDMYGYLVSVYTVASLLGVVLLGAVKLKPKARFWAMALGFSCSVPFYVLVFLSDQFVPMCIFAFIASFLNCVGNTVFSASLMLALPEENRSAILGFISSASVGCSALSTLLYGLIGDVFPLYLVFAAGNLISLAPMLYLCFHSKTREFVLEHCE
jgi:MFS family permease